MGLFELSLAKQCTAEMVAGRSQGYRVVIDASVQRGFTDAGVFLFLRRGENVDFFTGVCSPADLSDYMLDRPDEHGWVRRSKLDLIFADRLTGEETTVQILAELQILTDEMSKLSTSLSTVENIIVASAT